ncbi:MAG TPA: hypothetical protein VIM61_10690 [Chthoniobacterales bacterium]|jgi:hypothetical protein
MSDAFEQAAEAAILDHVLSKLRLGIYDPLQPRRPAVEVASFEIQMLEHDEESLVAHAAGPVVLRGPAGEVEQFLRVSVPVDATGAIPDGAEMRAVYIVETNPENGACKETAALANA